MTEMFLMLCFLSISSRISSIVKRTIFLCFYYARVNGVGGEQTIMCEDRSHKPENMEGESGTVAEETKREKTKTRTLDSHPHLSTCFTQILTPDQTSIRPLKWK